MAGRRFRDELTRVGGLSALDWLSARLTLGGLAQLRRRFPTQSLRLLIPQRGLGVSETASPTRLYAVLESTPAELILTNQLLQGREAHAVARWLASPHVEVRGIASPTALPWMALAHGEAAPPLVLVGNPEVTAECLSDEETMAEAGLMATTPEVAGTLGAAFGRWWALGRDLKPALLERLAVYWRANTPQDIYFLSLWHLFKDKLDAWQGVLGDDRSVLETPIWKALFPFQTHGALAALGMMRREGGCILADSVGLGKTYTALAIIKAYERMGKRVLALCPKKLRPNWERFLNDGPYTPFRDAYGDPDFRYALLAHTDLAPGRKVNPGRGGRQSIEEIFARPFGLVVIDESHAFRNRGGQRYDFLLGRLLRPHPDTRLLLLSATPVNNRMADLANQLALIARGDATGASPTFKREIGNVLVRAQKAVTAWNRALVEANREERAIAPLTDALPPETFRLLERFTIARNRAAIVRFYANAARDIGAFPAREVRSEYPALDTEGRLCDLATLSQRLNELTLAAYNPGGCLAIGQTFRDEGNLSDEARQRALVALTRMNALKRLESSLHAFRKTLGEAVLSRTERQLEALARGRVRVPLVTAEALEADDWEPAPEGGDGELPADRFDVPRLQAALTQDRDTLRALLKEAEAVTVAHDAKAQTLFALLRDKLARPLNPGNAKALIFSAFADTADYLAQALADAFPERTVACVTGGGGRVWRGGQAAPQSLPVESILARFAPVAQNARAQDRDWAIDWLVATDCLSEGQNLQDCDLVVNYDIHWNPLRLTQRAGRIDRIGSPNRRIRIVHFWPMRSLDRYIGLERRVRLKDAMMGAVGGSPALTEETEMDLAYRERQLEAIRDGAPGEEALLNGQHPERPNDFVAELDAWLRDRDKGEQRRLACETAPLGLCATVPPTLTPAFRALGVAPPTRGALFLLRRRGLTAEERAANPFGDLFLLAVDAQGAPVPGGGDGTPLAPLTAWQALALLRGLCRDRAEAAAALDEAFAKAGPKALEPALNGALRLLNAAAEATRATLLLGDAPFDFHSGRTDAEATLSLVTFVVIGDLSDGGARHG